MYWYKTLAWWVIFRCRYTLTSNNQLCGCLNPPCLVLFSAVDVVAKHSSVNKTTMNTGSRFPKAFVSSAGILNLPITSIPVDNFNDRALWCKPTGINYNMHGWILCRYCAAGWFWWIRGLRAVTMWSSSSFTKMITKQMLAPQRLRSTTHHQMERLLCEHNLTRNVAYYYRFNEKKMAYIIQGYIFHRRSLYITKHLNRIALPKLVWENRNEIYKNAGLSNLLCLYSW